MKNLTIFISLFLILISITGYTQDFGTPPGRQITIQQPIQQTYYRTQSFVVIPLYHMSPALIASIMGGEIIYDEPRANSSGGRQNSGYNQNQNYGSSNRGNSRGNYNY